MDEARESFEKWYESTKTYRLIYEYIALHNPLIKSVFQRRGKNYINDAVQEAWNAWKERQKKIDALTLQVAEMKSRLNDAYTDGQSAMYIARQSEIDEPQKQVDAVKGLAQTLWKKSEEKHQQGKVWESKTLGECADEILDVLEQALKGG